MHADRAIPKWRVGLARLRETRVTPSIASENLEDDFEAVKGLTTNRLAEAGPPGL